MAGPQGRAVAFRLTSPNHPPQEAKKARAKQMSEEFLAAARRRLKTEIRVCLEALDTDTQAELNQLLETQAILEDRNQKVTAAVAAVDEERAALEHAVLSLSQRQQELDQWRAANEQKLKESLVAE